MHCERFKSRLNFVLDERLDPQADALLRGHAHRCSDCADLLEMHADLLSAVEKLPHPRPRADFSFRVMAAFEAAAPQISVAPKANEPARPKSSRRWRILSFAAAAAVLIAVVFASSIDRPEAKHIVNVAEQTPNATVSVGTRPHLLTPFAMGPGYLGDDLDAQRVWADELSQGIQPVKSSVYSALQTIWRTLPASEIARVIL